MRKNDIDTVASDHIRTLYLSDTAVIGRVALLIALLPLLRGRRHLG